MSRQAAQESQKCPAKTDGRAPYRNRIEHARGFFCGCSFPGAAEPSPVTNRLSPKSTGFAVRFPPAPERLGLGRNCPYSGRPEGQWWDRWWSMRAPACPPPALREGPQVCPRLPDIALEPRRGAVPPAGILRGWAFPFGV